jgi:hypothetical protein
LVVNAKVVVGVQQTDKNSNRAKMHHHTETIENAFLEAISALFCQNNLNDDDPLCLWDGITLRWKQLALLGESNKAPLLQTAKPRRPKSDCRMCVRNRGRLAQSTQL